MRGTNAHGTGARATLAWSGTYVQTGTPGSVQNLKVGSDFAALATIRWTRPANASQFNYNEVPWGAYYVYRNSIIGHYELQVCHSGETSCRNQDDENWYVLARLGYRHGATPTRRSHRA